jgi:hypothetical protein
MRTMKAFKAIVLLFALFAILCGGFTMISASQVEAAKCCWVRVCSNLPPYACWDECRPCPRFP